MANLLAEKTKFEAVQKRAAEYDPDALFALGKMYENPPQAIDGLLIEKDLDEALWCYRASVWAAFKKGKKHRDSAAMAAKLLYEGTGTQRDTELAYHYFKFAADQGHVGATYSLGNYHMGGKMMSAGCGYPRNPVLGIRYLEKAANAGSLQAMLDLSMAYNDGHGVIRDEDKACEWSIKAAEKGSVTAMYNAGHWLEKGLSYDRAGYWFNEAAKRGNKDALRRLRNYKYIKIFDSWKWNGK
jgi:TPR repeat protein